MTYDPCEAVHEALERLECHPRGPVWKFSALCPVHEDRDPSLSVAEGVDGRALVLCRAGCRTEDVVGALGLSWGDLFPADHRHAPKARRPKVTAEPPAVSVLVALWAAGIGYRLTASPHLFVADYCPRCQHRALWLHNYGDHVRLSCWTNGCDSDQILDALEQLVTEVKSCV